MTTTRTRLTARAIVLPALACAAALAVCNTVKGVGTDIQKAGEAGSKALDESGVPGGHALIDLAGKPIIITGASAGIGAAAAVACAEARMPVLLAARRAEKLIHIAERITSRGGRAIAMPADVADPAQCRALVDRAMSEFGSVYAVLANAGYGHEGATHEMPESDIRALIETNFYGTLNTIRPALPHMLRERRGHVLITSSCLSKLGTPYHAAYSASKAMQDHFGRAMRLELADSGVFVSTIHPIGTSTDFFEAKQARSGKRDLSLRSSDRFTQTPERVARAIVACLRRPRGEVWTSFSVRSAMALATFAPNFADRVMRRLLRQRQRQIASPARPDAR